MGVLGLLWGFRGPVIVLAAIVGALLYLVFRRAAFLVGGGLLGAIALWIAIMMQGAGDPSGAGAGMMLLIIIVPAALLLIVIGLVVSFRTLR